MPEPAMTADELDAKLAEAFPELFQSADRAVIERLDYGACRLRLPFQSRYLRPGGTISGPTMMQLTDLAMYVAVLGAVGWVPLAVTSQLNIHFLRRPEARDLIAEARLLRVGGRTAVGDVTIWSDGHDAPVAHATSTYAIPSR
ncbi:MAG: PaaI family thioesterase [Rhizobiales bacterium]|nr:PaaI family thioesterase [Hyphomicrobiales bacterium]